jgi:hypothetical protein
MQRSMDHLPLSKVDGRIAPVALHKMSSHNFNKEDNTIKVTLPKIATENNKISKICSKHKS